MYINMGPELDANKQLPQNILGSYFKKYMTKTRLFPLLVKM